jgi:hypothetical protein
MFVTRNRRGILIFQGLGTVLLGYHYAAEFWGRV